jgi:thioredoxin 1
LPYLVAAVFVMFALIHFGIVFGMKRLEGRAAPDMSGLLDELSAPHPRVLFYFFSPHCRACDVMAPIIDGLAERYGNVVKVDVQQSPDVARRFAVLATPATVLVDEGRVAKVVVGATTRTRLETLLT